MGALRFLARAVSVTVEKLPQHPRNGMTLAVIRRVVSDMTASSTLPQVLVIDDEMGPRESLRMLLKPNYRRPYRGLGRSGNSSASGEAARCGHYRYSNARDEWD